MIVYDVATKVLVTESFPEHNIDGLSLALHLLFFSQEKPLRWKEIHTHTHTHTYTYTYTHTHMISSNPVRFSAEILFSSLVSFAFCLLVFFF